MTMHTIYKYPIPVEDKFTLALPVGADVLTVQVQHDEVYLWARVNTENPAEPRHFRMFGTGHLMPEWFPWPMKHIGTFQLEGGSLVFHLFEDNVLRED